ncbi:hypothetical protein [Geobacter sp. FeAm09]|uniref:hypothetical protein n=1 Tax=Geobacter sp. FeAm09 TaxID=2597769 RepID=UPI00143D257C|nr:hypothetical protein [Geobacter sp. FeAm09]
MKEQAKILVRERYECKPEEAVSALGIIGSTQSSYDAETGCIYGGVKEASQLSI